MSSLCKVDSIQYDPESPISIPTVPIPDTITLVRGPSGQFSAALFGPGRGKVPSHDVPFSTSINVSDVGTFPLLSRRNGSGVLRKLQSVTLRINAYRPTDAGDNIETSGTNTLYRAEGDRYSQARYETVDLLGDFEATVTGATFRSGTEVSSVSGFNGKEWKRIQVKLLAEVSVAESDEVECMRDKHGRADIGTWQPIIDPAEGLSGKDETSGKRKNGYSSSAFELEEDGESGLEGFDREPQLRAMIRSLVEMS